MMKLRSKEFKSLAKGHSISKWQDWDLNLGLWWNSWLVQALYSPAFKSRLGS